MPMTRAAALKAWKTRRDRAAGVPIPTPEPGRLADYRRLDVDHFLTLLRGEQLELERHMNNPARAGYLRGVEGSGIGHLYVFSGGTFAGGRATLFGELTARRLHRIEVELESRGVDRERIDDIRFTDRPSLTDPDASVTLYDILAHDAPDC
jgi:hypothetical protein